MSDELEEPKLELGEVLLGLDEESEDEPDIEEDDGEELDPPEDGLVLDGDEGELDIEPELAPGRDVSVLLPPVLSQP